MSNVLCVAVGAQELDWYCENLQRAGHSVMAASSAQAAYRMLETERLDLLVTSWLLDGVTAAGVIEKAKSGRSVLVMVVSNFIGEAFQQVDASVDLFVEKPVTARNFLHFVDILLTSASREEARSKMAASTGE
jgi:DNA-binding response OmpR family regulator